MYELTSFLTTMAAASATIAAILGGFIASKLITLNSERTSTSKRLKQIGEELTARKDLVMSLQEENDEEDALDFIDEHIENLVYDCSFKDVYEEDREHILPEDVLLPFWERAQAILCDYHNTAEEGDVEYHEDVSKILAQKYSDDAFSSRVCQAIDEEFEKIAEEREREQQRQEREQISLLGFQQLADSIPFAEAPDITTQVTSYTYRDNSKRIAEQSDEIALLELQEKQLSQSLKTFMRPKGMRIGLALFAYLAIFCIFLPLLLLIPDVEGSLTSYQFIEITLPILFFVGLAAIFIYLAYLLREEKQAS